MQRPPAGGIHDEAEIEAIVDLLRTSNLDIGESVAALEAGVADLLAKRHGVMVNSGSSALRLAIDLLNLDPGDEIIASPLTFSTDIAPMVQSGLVPVFVDVEPDTYQIDVAAIPDMIGPRTRAILVPNLYATCPTGTPSGPSPTPTGSRWSRTRATCSTRGSATSGRAPAATSR